MKALRYLNAGDMEGLVGMKVSPNKYMSAEHYLRDAQVVSFLKKHKSLAGVDDRKAESNCEDLFFKAESLCFQANERLSPLLFDLSHYGERLGRIFRLWRKEVRRVLGSAPKKSELRGRFGPGSTFLNVGDDITVAHKLSENASATRQALFSFSSVWDETAWSRYACAALTPCGTDLVLERGELRLYLDSDWAPRDFEVVMGNRFTTVAKTALTRRGICIEPSLNVFYQLSLGECISKRMCRALGWKKEIMQDLHRGLARMGSLTGSNATIDLSMASDTVCKVLVKLLLPSGWYDLLYQLRSPKTLVRGHWHLLEKFSSMGNGYTFELETLLFLTLCNVVRREVGDLPKCDFGDIVSVFGDDIIVPKHLGREVISVLRFCGFVVNEDKTFLDGPFRESCGGDYFHGIDVRPHFQKELLDEPHRIIACVNGLLRYRDRIGHACGRYDHVPAISWLTNRLPRQIRRCRGPAELGDLVLTNHDPNTWDSVVRNSIRYIRTWRPVPNPRIGFQHFRPGVVHALALYTAGSGVSFTPGGAIGPDYTPSEDKFRRSGVIPRVNGSYVSGYRFGRVAYS